MNRYWHFVLIAIVMMSGCDSKSTPSRGDLPLKSDVTSQTLKDWNASECLDQANKAFRNGNTLSAQRAIREFQSQSVMDVELNIQFATLLHSMGRTEEAVDVYDQLAQAHAQREPFFQSCAADLVCSNGNVIEGIDRFESVLSKSPELADVRRRLIEILESEGRCFDANQHIRYLLPRATLTLDELCGLVFPIRVIQPPGDRDDDKAKAKSEDFTKAGKRLPEINHSFLFHDPRRAVELIEAAPSEFQSHPLVVARRIRCLAQMQSFDRLPSLLRATPDSVRRYPDYWIALGTLANHQRSAAATRCFVEAIKREPASVAAFYGLALALEIAGESTASEALTERAMLLDQIDRATRKLRENPRVGSGPYFQIADLMQQCGRSLEALAWQELAIVLFEPVSQRAQIIRHHKQKFFAQHPIGWDTKTMLGNLSFDQISTDQAGKWQAEMKTLLQGDREETKIHLGDSSPQGPDIPPRFREVATSRGIQFQYRNAEPIVERNFRIFEGLGSGVVCLDYDRDGNPDLFFGQAGATMPDEIASLPDPLFRNLDGQFVDVTTSAQAGGLGYTIGLTSGDLNQDGFPDLVVGNLGSNLIWINQGDGTFDRADQESFLGADSFTTGLAVADLNGDSLPDIVEVSYVDDSAIYLKNGSGKTGRASNASGPLWYRSARDRQWLSETDGRLVERPFDRGEDNPGSTGLGVLVADIEASGGNEIFIANDMRPNHFWISDGANDRENAAVLRGVSHGRSGIAKACMGIAAGDFNGDQTLDLQITNFHDEWSNLYLQKKAKGFVDAASPMGLSEATLSMVGFGTQAVDYDNDGDQDLMIGNGHIEDLSKRNRLFEMPTQFFVRRGNRFELTSVTGDDKYWNRGHLSRGMAKLDFNRDGRIDIAISDLVGKASLLQNETESSNHCIELVLVGVDSERDAVGSTVALTRVTSSEAMTTGTQWTQTGDGYCAKNQTVLHFGMGSSKQATSIEIRWPDETAMTLDEVPANRKYLVVQGQTDIWELDRWDAD